RFAVFGLHPRLFVESDLEVGEQTELRPGRRVARPQRLVVVREGRAEQTLPIRRISVAEMIEKGRQSGCTPGGQGSRREIACEGQPDLLEYLQVPASDGVASSRRNAR